MKRNLYFFGALFLATICCGYIFVYAHKNNQILDHASTPKKIRYQLNKMWRDGAAAEMESVDGAIVHRYILSDKDYKHQLDLKAREEMEEVIAAKNDQERMEEIGDLFEVLDCMIAAYNLDKNLIEKMQPVS